MIDQERSENLKVLLNLTGVDDFANQLKDGSKDVMNSVKDMTKDVSNELNSIYETAGKGLSALTSDARDKNEGWHGELIKKNASTSNELSDTWKTYYKGDLKNLSQYGKGVTKYFNKVNAKAKTFNHWTDIDESRYTDFEKGMFKLTGSIKETKSLMKSLGKGMNLTKFHKAMELAGADSNDTAESLGLLYQTLGASKAQKAFKQFIKIGGSAVSTAEKLSMFSESVKAYQDYSENTLNVKMNDKDLQKYSKTFMKTYKMLRSITGVGAEEAKGLADEVTKFNMLASSPDKANLLFGQDGDKLSGLYTSMGVLQSMYKDQKAFSKDFEKNGVVSVMAKIQKEMGGVNSKDYKDFTGKFFGVVGESFGDNQDLFKTILMKNLSESGVALDQWNKAQLKKTESAGKMIKKLAKSYKTGFTAEDVLSKTEEVIENKLIGLTYKDSSRYLKQYTKSLSGFSNEMIGVAKNNETYFVGWGVRMASSIKRLGAMGIFAGLRKEAGTTGKTLAMASDMLVDVFTKSHGVLTAMGALGFRISDLGKVFYPFTKSLEVANALTFGALKPFGKFAGIVGVLSFAVGKLNENMKLTAGNMSGKFSEVAGKLSYDIMRMTSKNAIVNSVKDLKNVLSSDEVKSKLKEVNQVWGTKISDARLGIRKLSNRDKKKIAKNFNIPLQHIDHLVKNNKLMSQINKSVKDRTNTAKIIGKEYIRSVFGGDISKRSPMIQKQIKSQQKMIISQMGLSMANLQKEIAEKSKKGKKVTISDLLIEKMNDRSKNILKAKIMGYFKTARGYMSVGLDIIGKGFKSIYEKMTELIFGSPSDDGKKMGMSITDRLKIGFNYAKSWIMDDKNSNKLSGILGLAVVGGLASKSIRQGFAKSLFGMAKGGLKISLAPMSLLFGSFFKLLNTRAMIPALAVGGAMSAPFMYKMISGNLSKGDISSKIKTSMDTINKSLGGMFGKSGGIISDSTMNAMFGNMDKASEVIKKKIPFLSKKISKDMTMGINQSMGDGMSHSGKMAGMGFLGAFALPLISKEGRSVYGKGLKGMLTSGTKIVTSTGKSLGGKFLKGLKGDYGKAGKLATIGVSLYGIGKAFSFIYDLFSGDKNKAIATLASTLNVDASKLTTFFTAKHWEDVVIPSIGKGLEQAPKYIMEGISKGFNLARNGMKSYITTLFKEPTKMLGATVVAISGVALLMKYLKRKKNPQVTFQRTSISNQKTMISHLGGILKRVSGGRAGSQTVGNKSITPRQQKKIDRRLNRSINREKRRENNKNTRFGRMKNRLSDGISGGASKAKRGGGKVIGSVKKFGKLGAATAVFGLAGAASGINDLIKGEKGLGESMWNVAKGIASIHPVGLVIAEGADALYKYFKGADKISADQLDQKIKKDKSLRAKFIEIDKDFSRLATMGAGERKKKVKSAIAKLEYEIGQQNLSDGEQIKAVMGKIFTKKHLNSGGVKSTDVFDMIKIIDVGYRANSIQANKEYKQNMAKYETIEKQRQAILESSLPSKLKAKRSSELEKEGRDYISDAIKHQNRLVEENKKKDKVYKEVIIELSGDAGARMFSSMKSFGEVADFMTKFNKNIPGYSITNLSKHLSNFNFKSLDSFGKVISVFEKDKTVMQEFANSRGSFIAGISQISDRMVETMYADKALSPKRRDLMLGKMLTSVTGADKDFMTFISRLDNMPKMIDDSVKGLTNLGESEKTTMKDSLSKSYMSMIKQATGMSFATVQEAQAHIATMGDAELRKMKAKFKGSMENMGVIEMDNIFKRFNDQSEYEAMDVRGKLGMTLGGYKTSDNVNIKSEEVTKALELAYATGTSSDLDNYKQIMEKRGLGLIQGFHDTNKNTEMLTKLFISKALNTDGSQATLGLVSFNRGIDLVKGSSEAKMDALSQFADSARASVLGYAEYSSEGAVLMQDKILAGVQANFTQMNISGEVTMSNLKEKMLSLPEVQRNALYNAIVASSNGFNSIAKKAIDAQRSMSDQSLTGFEAFAQKQYNSISNFLNKTGLKALRTKSIIKDNGAINISESEALNITKNTMKSKEAKKLSRRYKVNIDSLSTKARTLLADRNKVITKESVKSEVQKIIAGYAKNGASGVKDGVLIKRRVQTKSERLRRFAKLVQGSFNKRFSAPKEGQIFDRDRASRISNLKLSDADKMSESFRVAGIKNNKLMKLAGKYTGNGITSLELEEMLLKSKRMKMSNEDRVKFEKMINDTLEKGVKDYDTASIKKKNDSSSQKAKKPGIVPRNTRQTYDQDSSGGYVQTLFNSNRDEETKKILQDTGSATQSTAQTIKQIMALLKAVIDGKTMLTKTNKLPSRTFTTN